MAKRIYVGVGGIARKVKKAYIGVEGLARKVKKAYIGVGGVARPVFSGGELVYYGSSEDGAVEVPLPLLSECSVGTTKNHVIYYGGSKSNGNSWNSDSDVRVYDKFLTAISGITPLTHRRESAMSANVGGTLHIGDGLIIDRTVSGTNYSYCQRRETYDSALTHNVLSSYLGLGGYGAASSLNNYFLFAGGEKKVSSSSSWSYSNSVVVYDLSLSQITSPSISLPFGVAFLTACRLGDSVIFAGGKYSSGSSPRVTMVNSSLTATQLSYLSLSRGYLASATVGNYALFGGGENSSNSYGVTNVDVYDKSFTKITADVNFEKRRMNGVAGIQGQNYAVFAGGAREYNTETLSVEIYDALLTKHPCMNIPIESRSTDPKALGVRIDNYAVFAWSYSGSDSRMIVLESD